MQAARPRYMVISSSQCCILARTIHRLSNKPGAAAPRACHVFCALNRSPSVLLPVPLRPCSLARRWTSGAPLCTGRQQNTAGKPANLSVWRQVPLDTLSAELEAHLGTLKQRLVEVINEDYADFVSLSGKLVNVDGAVLRMHRPLLDVRARARIPAAHV